MTIRAFALLATSALLTLSGCSLGGGTQYSYQNVTVTIAPQVQSVPAGGTQTFTATITNAPNSPLWTLNGAVASTLPNSTIGTFAVVGDGSSGTYTAPTSPPIYTDAQVAQGHAQGTVTLGALADNDPTHLFSFTAATVTFAIVGPISAGLSPATATVKLGSTQQFTAYVVGTLSNGYTLKVNGFTGGGTDVGTISATGLYTAPATMPMTGSTVTITAVSNADTTKTATATVTLQ